MDHPQRGQVCKNIRKRGGFGADVLYFDELISPMKTATKGMRVVANCFEYAAMEEQVVAVLVVNASG